MTIHDDQRFAPIDLGVGARVELQRQIHRRLAQQLADLANVMANGRFRSLESLLLDNVEYGRCRPPLFAGQGLVLGQQFLDAGFVWS